MRKVPVFPFAIFGALALLSTPMMGREVTIGGTHGAGEIQQKCEAAGGDFAGGLKGGGYGCMNGSKGTSIVCTNNGKCTGSVPAKAPGGGDIGTILRGGSPVSATGRGTSTGNKPAGNTHPVITPPVGAGANKGPSGDSKITVEKGSGGKH
jgi:hypothetical protein